MVNEQHTFAVEAVLQKLRHYLPQQAPLKDFIHHNTLHAFQHLKFNQGIRTAAEMFGYKTSLSLKEYRDLCHQKKISLKVLEQVIAIEKGEEIAIVAEWMQRTLNTDYVSDEHTRIGKIRALWKEKHHIDADKEIHPLLFRTICSYLDQGIAIWPFPTEHNGFLASVKELERKSASGFFRTKKVKKLLEETPCELTALLSMVVGDERYYTQYLFDQQFAHQGWSGMVAAIEAQPETLLDKRKITLHDFIVFELLLEIDLLEYTYGIQAEPLCTNIKVPPASLFHPAENNELSEVLALWQLAYEWTYYDEVLAAIHINSKTETIRSKSSFQAMFCIDDRECSIRRYVEAQDPDAETFGTPGFFGVAFYYQPENGKFMNKLCPAPVTPAHLIKEVGSANKHTRDLHLIKHTHHLFSGWLITQTLGFWSALRLFLNVFKPSMSPATTISFRHMDQFSKLTVEHIPGTTDEHQLQIGFTVEEMAVHVEGLLKSIGLVRNLARLVYVIGHGSSSANNPHYAAYDCGACSGRPGSVNARVACHMANHPEVRSILQKKGVVIPAETRFVAGLHDTTRDEIVFYDEDIMPSEYKAEHEKHKTTFLKALDQNAKERSRRFEVINTSKTAAAIHEQTRLRSVSLFEPRPELNHATNSLCIIGRRSLTRDLFLDRRAFLNSYDYREDPEGMLLVNILKAAAPVCGGINLEYYFSRVDNQKLGAGTKLPHNVMGLIGVANGTDGDLRPGLPSQMIEVHDPVRLLIVAEHFPEVVLEAVKKIPATYEWFMNEWIHLVAIDPSDQQLYRFSNGTFIPYKTTCRSVRTITEIEQLIERSSENIPVHLIQH